MTEKRPGPTLDGRDFDAIQAAVMETERGRWFLGEFARRNRLGETGILLEAIGRLEQSIGGPPPPTTEESPARDALSAISASLARALAELATTSEGIDGAATFESVARSAGLMQAAGADIHDAAERVGEAAWRLREEGARGTLCSALEAAAAEISTACAFGGLTATRMATLADALIAIERVLDALPLGWRAAPCPAVPVRPANEQPLRSVPEVRAEEVEVAQPVEQKASPEARAASEPPPGPAAGPARTTPPPRPEPRRMPVPSLAAIDALDFRERLKLFT